MSFYQKLQHFARQQQSLLCVGLDPVLGKLPDTLPQTLNGIEIFLREIIHATAPFALAYKPNLAYFEAHGSRGITLLEKTLEMIPDSAITIGDAKRGDVGHSSKFYAKALFEAFQFDAITVHPYQGTDSLEPFFAYHQKGVFVCCLTSNAGASDFILPNNLYLEVARKAQEEWNTNQNVGLVVGATYPEKMALIRQVAPDLPFLIPGVGVQQGDMEATLKEANNQCAVPYLINASRSILYASKGKNFAEQAAKEAKRLQEAILKS